MRIVKEYTSLTKWRLVFKLLFWYQEILVKIKEQ